MKHIRELESKISAALTTPVSGITAPAIVASKPSGTGNISGRYDYSEDILAASDKHSIIAESDLQGNIISANENFVKLSGYSHEELIGAPHSILCSGFHPDSFFKRMWQTIQRGEDWRGTIKNRAKDGHHYWVKTLIRPVKDETGAIIRYVSIRTDVTSLLQANSDKKYFERKAKNAVRINYMYELDRKEKTLPEILNQALNILFAANWPDRQPAGAIFLVNERNQDMSLISDYNLEPEQNRSYRVISFDDPLCGKAARTKTMVFSQIDTPDEAASIKYAIPVAIGNKILGVLLIILQQHTRLQTVEEENLSDIANAMAVIISFKRREEELVAEREKAEMAVQVADAATVRAEAGQRAKANFLATMSHELRTPLNGVVGMLHVLKQSGLSKEQHEDLDVAMTSADLLLSLINDILDFSKLDYGALEMEREVINLRDMVHKTQMPLKQMALDKGLEYSCTVADDVPEFCIGDSTRIRQVGVNLVSNAIKFTDSGSIRLSVDMCEPPAGKTGGQWTISKIVDTGVGIPEDVQDRIFDRFSQADDTITRKFGGTGLGLAICRQLVELMGGEIGLESKVGEGSCFWYKLPCIAVDKDGNRLPAHEPKKP